ncbi:hypothetical protein TrST_g1435 [Triparma strigata]|uniref:Uncharacterized protein n=1 Tax=Triparma strigata TaxID=1606541 RepID=A0A9W7BZ74_9STRA|nr:hypothetical protein TrST_g1435 [Triparma strigata]
MGAAVSVDAGFAGGPASIISDIEARRLLGGAMWPLYADEFNSLPQPVTLIAFKEHAEKCLQQLVLTGKLSLTLEFVESGSLFNDDKNINIKIVPKAGEATVVKKKKRRKSSLMSAKDASKTPKNVFASLHSGEESKQSDIVFENVDEDVPKKHISKKTAMFGVSEKGRNLVGVDGMSEANAKKKAAYQERMRAEAEGRPTEVQEKVLRQKEQVHSKKTAFFGVTEKGRHLVEDDAPMSEKNKAKIEAYHNRLTLEEGQPSTNAEKALREKAVLEKEKEKPHQQHSKGSIILGVSAKARHMVEEDVGLSAENQAKVKAYQDKLKAEESGGQSPRTKKRAKENQALSTNTSTAPSKRSLILGVNTKARNLVTSTNNMSPEHMKKVEDHKQQMRLVEEQRLQELRERLEAEGLSQEEVNRKSYGHIFHPEVTVNELLDLRSKYLASPDEAQEFMVEDMLQEIDRICQAEAPQHNITPGDVLMDKDGCWDEDPCSLVPDIVRMAWDFVLAGDLEVHNETSDGDLNYSTAIRLFAIGDTLTETEHADILCGLGISISDIGYHDKGIELLEHSRFLDSENHITLLYLGVVYYENEQLEDAAEVLDKAIRICAKANDHHHLEEALRKRGNAFEDMGDFKSAAKNYAIAMELQPEEPTFFSARALCLKELGLYAKASTTFESASQKYISHGDEEAHRECLEEAKVCKEKALQKRAAKKAEGEEKEGR